VGWEGPEAPHGGGGEGEGGGVEPVGGADADGADQDAGDGGSDDRRRLEQRLVEGQRGRHLVEPDDRGMLALRVGLSMAESPALTAVSTNRGQTPGRPSEALTARPTLVTPSSTCMTSMSRRRSTASAIDPPMREQARRGPSCAALTRPTMREEPVSSNTWNGTATVVTWRR
jgi:hypothetical protein